MESVQGCFPKFSKTHKKKPKSRALFQKLILAIPGHRTLMKVLDLHKLLLQIGGGQQNTDSQCLSYVLKSILCESVINDGEVTCWEGQGSLSLSLVTTNAVFNPELEARDTLTYPVHPPFLSLMCLLRPTNLKSFFYSSIPLLQVGPSTKYVWLWDVFKTN